MQSLQSMNQMIESLDNVDQVRLALEIEALIGIFAQVDLGAIDLVSSEVLELECDRVPTPLRRRYSLNLLGQAKEFVIVTEQIEQRARYLISFRIKPFDALHLACAEANEVDYFCTCDDRFLRRAKVISDLRVMVVAPLELIEELDL